MDQFIQVNQMMNMEYEELLYFILESKVYLSQIKITKKLADALSISNYFALLTPFHDALFAKATRKDHKQYYSLPQIIDYLYDFYGERYNYKKDMIDYFMQEYEVNIDENIDIHSLDDLINELAYQQYYALYNKENYFS